MIHPHGPPLALLGSSLQRCLWRQPNPGQTVYPWKSKYGQCLAFCPTVPQPSALAYPQIPGPRLWPWLQPQPLSQGYYLSEKSQNCPIYNSLYSLSDTDRDTVCNASPQGLLLPVGTLCPYIVLTCSNTHSERFITKLLQNYQSKQDKTGQNRAQVLYGKISVGVYYITLSHY